MPTTTIKLDTATWTLALGDRRDRVPAHVPSHAIPATVPGCVHTDLLAAGLIPDPYLDRNELLVEWIGWTDWCYTATFNLDAPLKPDEHLDLVCDGLDTLATLTLNGTSIGRADNMHRRYRFDVGAAIRAGANQLTIDFAAPQAFVAAQRQRPEYDKLPCSGNLDHPEYRHNLIRKMACNFGWDWGPGLATCGIHRGIALQRWTTAHLGDIRPVIVRADAASAQVRVQAQATCAVPAAAVRTQVKLIDPAGRCVAAAQAAANEPVTLTVDQPRLWWPVGYGEQPLYTLAVELCDAGGRILDHQQRRIGLRTVELVTTPDGQAFEELGQGETFHFRINGKRIYCKGANWIPDDCFPHRVDEPRYRQRIDQALAMHMNMLRVWGGGLYETDTFYDICDEKGLMVWQDFCCACACYSEDDAFRKHFEAEARDNVSRLASHPALVLWNGCNENIWGVFDWGETWVKARTGPNPEWGAHYYFELFPKVVGELSPDRPYWPGSPFSGTLERQPNANEFGNRHIWDVWNGHGDYRNYLSHFPRFASEFGFHGPPTWPTLDRSIPADQRQWLSPAMVHHNKQGLGGQQRALDRIADSFVVPSDFDDLWFLASLNQARAITLGCEWFRAMSPWNSGALFWQLNDCWPVASWSAIDGDGRLKLLAFAGERFFRPRLLAILPQGVVPVGDEPQALTLYLHNDTDQTWSDTAAVCLRDYAGQVRRTWARPFTVEPRGRARLELEGLDMGKPGELLTADVTGDRAWWFFGRDRDCPYPTPQFTLEPVASQGDRHTLLLTAHTLLREVCLFPERINPRAVIDRQLLTLLPGERATVTVTGLTAGQLEQLCHLPCFRCSNLFGRTTAAV
jgi:beta-mannosidase